MLNILYKISICSNLKGTIYDIEVKENSLTYLSKGHTKLFPKFDALILETSLEKCYKLLLGIWPKKWWHGWDKNKFSYLDTTYLVVN